MAKATPRRGAPPPRAAAKSRKVAPAAEGEGSEEAGGMNIDFGVGLFTLLMLIAALVLMNMIAAKNGDNLF